MQIKSTIGWLADRMPSVLDYYRKKRTYGSRIIYGSSAGWFCGKSETRVAFPKEDEWEYWEIMSTFSPWNEITGVWNIISKGDMDTEILLSCKLYAMILNGSEERKGEAANQ